MVRFSDIRISLRSLRRLPVFSASVIGILALGIGANTAVFSLIYGILLRPFPYREPDRLVRVQSQYTKSSGNIRANSIPDVDDWRAQNRTFTDLGAYLPFDTDLQGDGPAKPVRMAWVTPPALWVTGVNPVLGRTLAAEDDRPGGDANKSVISYRLWQSEFGGDAGILDRTLHTAMGTFRVVGVMPPGFQFPDQTDVWAPIQSGYNRGNVKRGQFRGSRPYAVIGRLKPGITIAQARGDLETVAAGLETAYPADNYGVRPVLTSLRDAEVGNIRPYLLMLLGAVGMVLLICCANVANLLLARSSARVREFAVRTALGASRARLVQHLLTESLVLAFAGGILGLLLAFTLVPLILRLIPTALPFWMRIEVDGGVLAFNAAVSLLTATLFGLMPALELSRLAPGERLKNAARGSTAGGSSLLRDALVVAEVSLSLLLLAGAGLLMKSFLHLQNVDVGFRPEGVLTARVSPFRQGTVAQKTDAYASFYRQVLDQIETLPGVEAAGGAVDLPFTGGRGERYVGEVTIRGQADREQQYSAPASALSVSPGYFRAMGVPLLSGRTFTEADNQKAPLAVIISARTAELLWPGQNPLGQQLRWGRIESDNQWPWRTVVGVVGNVKSYATDPERTIELYYSYRQQASGSFYFTVRTSGKPESLASGIRAAIHQVDKDTAVVSVKTMEDIVAESIWQRRLWSVLLALFAATALLLAAAGLYGVMSFLVNQRTREIGIRMALGAQRSNVIANVMSRGMTLAGIGALLGLLASYALTWTLQSLLFGVTPSDPLISVSVTGALGAVAALACYVPARRASRIDPLIALRQE